MPKTVKVRIAVAVDPRGHWNAAGWGGSSDNARMEAARDHVEEGDAMFWIEAELPVPERDAVTIQGTVSDA